jgi:DNA-binding transcriptional LysR family regulator|tara:strand:- start:775 stop:1668 length:894 start_codon:yes stop_codon:yes gene_type:complete
MEIKHLRSFAMTAQLNSISKAAKRLNIGQPTVTTHIQKLESELQIILFDRVKRPIVLTKEGIIFSNTIINLLESIDNITTANIKNNKDIVVTIGATYDIIPHILFDVIKDFLKQDLNIPISIRSGHRRDVINMLQNREIDFGIIPGKTKSQNIHFEKLFNYNRVLITPKNHPLTKEKSISLNKISKYPFIMMESHSYTRELIEQEFSRNNLSFNVIIELDSIDFIKQFVEIGMGISIGPKLAIDKDDLNNIAIVDLNNILKQDECGIISLPNRVISKSAKTFIKFMKNTLSSSKLLI